MAFGFPAQHTETYRSTKTLDEEHKHVLASARALNWKLREQSEYESSLTFSAGSGWNTRGELVTVRFLEHPVMSIESRCYSAIDWWDWGKNQKNVQSLSNELNRLGATP